MFDPEELLRADSGLELVPLPQDSCAQCGSDVAIEQMFEDALLRHGGYGGTRRTDSLVCTAECGWTRVVCVATERPPRR